MLTFNKLFYALAFLGGSTAAQATDGTGNLVLGRTGERINKPGADLKTAEYHYYANYENVSGTHNGIQLSEAILLGSFDPQLPSNFIF